MSASLGGCLNAGAPSERTRRRGALKVTQSPTGFRAMEDRREPEASFGGDLPGLARERSPECGPCEALAGAQPGADVGDLDMELGPAGDHLNEPREVDLAAARREVRPVVGDRGSEGLEVARICRLGKPPEQLAESSGPGGLRSPGGT
jgi:hypothetical protein